MKPFPAASLGALALSLGAMSAQAQSAQRRLSVQDLPTLKRTPGLWRQGLAAPTMLQGKRVPSELLVFQDENHWLPKPRNSQQSHETVLAWLDRWLRQGK